MASVFEKQNEPEMQMLLCAQRKEYSRLKSGRFWFVFVSVFLATAATIWIAVANDTEVASALTAFNVLLIFIRDLIKGYFEKRQEHAAKIQQYFDICCYNAALSRNLIDPRSIFLDSEIDEIRAKERHEDLSPFANWYSDYRSSSPTEQILKSQRTNICWDVKLRRFYRNSVIMVLSIIVVGIIAYCIYSDARTETIFALLSCSVLFMDCSWDSLSRLTKDIKRLDSIMNTHMAVELEMSTNHPIGDEKLKEIQNEIFSHRKTCFLIPDSIYNLRKSDYQSLEDAMAEMRSQV